ncbi:rRNA (guanine-N1)-methyltransferase [Parashewanella spongiae]|uniref:rRNA (Guanine-N1)-methyltransferase n=2 Tax=Parashewanella spongiae TaxID=342950 RepID=A0A3A6TJW7_9GAMM|nr:rRNA (guanine-N1)-methyltransferase [Parashewanella spongiae]
MSISKIGIFSTLFSLIAFAGLSVADDTELYVFESSVRSGARPQVLIIFDNSGSMRTNEPNSEASYDPNVNYGVPLDSSRLFYSKGGLSVTSIPRAEPSELRYFSTEINGCETSKQFLNEYGVFTGFFREYRFAGQNGTWDQLPDTDGTSIVALDCFDDIESKEWRNALGQPNGFPVDSLGTADNPQRYTSVNSNSQDEIDAAAEIALQTGFGTGQAITIYTENYIRWFNSTKSTVSRSRLEIAKEVAERTLITTPGVDFGLQIFNINIPTELVRGAGDNAGGDGGRIIAKVKKRTAIEKSTLINTINGLTSDTNTPLCESLYEAMRYFGGLSVDYGDDDYNWRSYIPNQPPQDPNVTQDGNYDSPFKACQNEVYVILITDGVPTADRNADTNIAGLPGVDTDPFENDTVFDSYYETNQSYLPNLAEWLHTQDVNSSLPGDQHVTTFTIGFSDGANDAEELLTETARLGGGKYFAARNAIELQSALQKVLTQILDVNASFTSPSIASNNFDRTQTHNSVYYAMFLPNKGPRWRGNLKKFRVTGSGDVVDKNGINAIGEDGNLKSSACSYWTTDSVCSLSSDGGDGNDVVVGGAAQVLQDASSRNLYFNKSGSLVPLTKTNASTRAGGDADLASYMQVDEAQLIDTFEWIKGKDVDDDDKDNNITEHRVDILGDPLHSKPLAIDFGTSSLPDIRIIMGTNHGFMHMFKDTGANVSETWAFMPYELLPNARELRANIPTGVHSVYGLDSPPVAYVKRNGNTIEKAWLFFGMRRGGKSYYALDITDPDSPTFKWKIDSASLGVAQLGQTWAEPVVTFLPGITNPVLIFGAGYSPSTKDITGVGQADLEGKGVFIVDATNGSLVHFFGNASGANITSIPNLTDSIPNSVATLDGTGDGVVDRLYATDTGGNVWRMDMPSANKSTWTAFKFADLGGNLISSDRRFYAEPVAIKTLFTNVIQDSTTDVDGNTATNTYYQDIPYDAVVIGSGLRPSPSNKERSDIFFTLQDRNITTRSYLAGDVPNALTIANLYDVTATPPASTAQNIAFGAKRGWYYSFQAAGEKSLSAATIVAGKVFFTSYVPGESGSDNQCLISGKGRLYGFDLHRGTRAYRQTFYEISDRVPDTPQLVVPANGTGPSYMYLVGIGAAGLNLDKVDGYEDGCPEGDDKCQDAGPSASRIYYHVNE